MAGPWERYAAPESSAGPWAKYAAPATPAQELNANPTDGPSFGQNVAAGAGKAVADTGRGIAQRSAEMLSNAPNSLPLLKGLNLLLEKVGMSPTAASADAKAAAQESRKLDAPLMATGGGVTGNVLGNVAMLAPTAGIAGANTVLGAGAIGATTGLAQPTVNARETATNALLGGAGGAAGQAVVNKIPGLLQGRIDKAAQGGSSQKFMAARAGAKEGYVVPPADLEPGMMTEALSGLSGKIKTAQVASERNQGVTNSLAKKALGLTGDEALDADTLQQIRRQAGTAYDVVKGAGAVKSDQAFVKALDDIAATQQGAGRSFPGLKDNGVTDLIATLKQPGFDAGDAVDATKVLREMADKAYRQGDNTLGKAAKGASDALEGMLERHLQATGNTATLKGFQDARKLIAKTYSVQKALNPQTGDVAADRLAKELAKGRPLTGELRQIAEMAQAFPKATQALKEAPKAVSPLDFAVASTTGLSTGNPLAGLLLGARPVARNVLLSGPMQKAAMKQGGGAPVSSATQALLENRLARLLAAPAGVVGGLQVGQ